MNKLFVMVGIPGSGKSTYAKKLSKKYNAKIFSSDEYRIKLCNDVNDQQHNNYVFNRLYGDLTECFNKGNNVIFDATNVSYKDRKRIFDLKLNKGEIIAVVVNTPLEKCLKQNEKRENVVPERVIYSMLSRFQFPHKFEGFDEIILVHKNNNKLNWIKSKILMNKMIKFDQKNKHHNNTLGVHCQKLASKYPYNSILWWAGLWHDVGKLFTQNIDEEGQAHYFSHEKYSVYYIITHLWMLPEHIKGCWGNLSEVIFFINNHMHIRDIIKSENAVKKYQKFWGYYRFSSLIEFMDNDNLSSK